MHLAVVSYPDIPEEAAQWIESLRRQYDQLQHDPIPSHFTFVFPSDTIQRDVLAEHVKYVAEHFAPIQFSIRCVLPVKDTLSPATYLLFTPDQGFSDVVFLHDALHTGPLEGHLRLDVPFIPHMTLGYTEDARYARQIADDVNGYAFELVGTIYTLAILAIGEDIQTIERIDL